jgi:fibronectin type 3 domain-containing protein
MSGTDTGYRGLVTPATLVATDGLDGKVNVTWGATPGTGITYELSRSDGGAFTVLATQAGTSYSDPNSASTLTGKLYTYQVKAKKTGLLDSTASNTDTGWIKVLPPTALTASVDSALGVTISWTAPLNTAATKYTIYRNTSGGTPTLIGEVYPDTSATTYTYVDGTAVAGTTYFYAVKTVGLDGTGESDLSTTVQAVRPSASAPSGLLASDGTSTSTVTLTWNPVSGTGVSYKVYRRDAGQTGSVLVQISSTSSTTYSDTLAEPGRVYEYALKSTKSGGGDSSMSDPDLGYRALSASSSMAATNGGSTTSVTLTWAPVTGNAGYDLYRSEGGGFGPVKSVPTGNTNTTDAPPSAVPGRLYTYMVKAKGPTVGTYTVADSAASPQATGGMNLPALSDVAATNGTSSAHVLITWSPLSLTTNFVTGYRVFRATGSSAPTAIADVDQNTNSYMDTTAVVGVTYAYSVKALGEASTLDSDFSNTDTGWRASSTTPTALAATDGASTQNVTLTWTAVAGSGVSYKIFRADYISATSTPATQIASTTGTSFVDTTAAAGKLYVYGVKAVGASGAGDSPMSVPDVGYRGLETPASIVATDGTEATGQGVLITWAAVPGAASYELSVTGGPVNETIRNLPAAFTATPTPSLAPCTPTRCEPWARRLPA